MLLGLEKDQTQSLKNRVHRILARTLFSPRCIHAGTGARKCPLTLPIWPMHHVTGGLGGWRGGEFWASWWIRSATCSLDIFQRQAQVHSTVVHSGLLAGSPRSSSLTQGGFVTRGRPSHCSAVFWGHDSLAERFSQGSEPRLSDVLKVSVSLPRVKYIWKRP